MYAYSVLFKQVTGIKSPFRHGFSALSASAPFKERKKATVAANNAEDRGIMARRVAKKLAE